MANQFASIQSNLAQLKNWYQGPIVSQFNDEIPIYRATEKIKDQWSGLQVVRPLKVRRNQGIGATSDGGVLPAIGRQTTIQAQIAAKYNYLRFGVTGPMIKASQSDRGSFVRAAAYELTEGYKDLKSDVNRQLSWDGSGWLAQVSANVVASNVVSLAGREAVEAAAKFLEIGMMIDIVTSAGALVASGIEITDIVPSGLAATVTLGAAVTTASGDYFVRSGSSGNEIQGLLTQLDGLTTTVFNINRSLYPSTRGNVLDMGGAQVTLDAYQALQNLCEQRGGADEGFEAWWSDFDSLRFYQKLLTPDKRYVNTLKGDGGFADNKKKYLEFNGIPMVPDKDCPRRNFLIPRNVLKSYVLAEMEFADETGTMYIAQAENDALESRIRFFANLFNEKASASGAMRNYVSP